MIANRQVPPRQQRQLNKALARTLTRACETAKAEIEGFAWVTHEVQWDAFPGSLRVIWIFESNADIARAIKEGWDLRLLSLSNDALCEADIKLEKPEQHVQLDSEEECRRADAGNWRMRLDRQKSSARRNIH